MIASYELTNRFLCLKTPTTKFSRSFIHSFFFCLGNLAVVIPRFNNEFGPINSNSFALFGPSPAAWRNWSVSSIIREDAVINGHKNELNDSWSYSRSTMCVCVCLKHLRREGKLVSGKLHLMHMRVILVIFVLWGNRMVHLQTYFLVVATFCFEVNVGWI